MPEVDLLAQIVDTLDGLPGLEIIAVHSEQVENGLRWDAIIHAEVKDRPVRFLVEVKASGYPRDIRNAIWHIEGGQRCDANLPDVPLIAVPALSESSRELLREHRLAHLDAGGTVYIDLPWAFYSVDRSVPPSRPRSLRDVYHGSSAQVLHVLLLQPDRAWHVNELADCAGVAASTAHRVCRYLEEQLWMDQEGKGPQSVRLLREPGRLLDAWAEAHTLIEYTAYRFHRWTQEPQELTNAVTNALETSSIEYALTLSSGAQLVAPYATNSDLLWVLVPPIAASNLAELVRKAQLQAVDDGESINLLATTERSPLLYRRQIHGMWVASDIQLYLDLSAWPQRGKEQARHLRAERIGF